MDAAPDDRRQLGQIMVDEGFLSAEQLQQALAEQNRTGTPLGKVLVDLGFVSPGAVANALAEQHGGLLRTEYGTSAGLREMAGRAMIRTDASPSATAPAVAMPAAPASDSAPAPALSQAPAASSPLGSGLRLAQPVAEAPVVEAAPAPEPQPDPEPQPEPEPEPEPEPQPLHPVPPAPEVESPPPAAAVARIEELESQLHAAVTERNSLAESFEELQARLSDAAQAHEAGVAAEVSERVGALESQLQAAISSRDELERAQQVSASRVGELEGRLAETMQGSAELDRELQVLRTVAAGRDAALEKVAALEGELEQLRTQGDDGSGAELHEIVAKRDAAEARAHALENDLGQLREQLDAALQAATAEQGSEAERVAALEAELASLREQSAGADEGLVAQLSGLNESLQALTSERDEAVARAAALEPELASLRDQLRDAAAPAADPASVDVSALRKQLAARERRLAESVGEIAKMNREHRALLQLVERQFQLEDASTAVPEPKGESVHVLFVPAATGYTLVERDGPAPEAGDVVEVDAERFVVRRLGPSPLPGPRRRCAYLERV